MSLTSLFTSSIAVVSSALAAAPQSRLNRFTSLTRREYSHYNKQVEDILLTKFYSKLNFNPEYQRPIGWSPEKMNAFILSVMKNQFISPVLTYELQESDKSTGRYTPDTVFDYEVMDGQHRLYTLNAFNSAKLQKIPGSTKEHIVHCNLEYVDENGNRFNEHIFHHQTEDTENWCREKKIVAKYLNEEEQKAFDKTNIEFVTIKSKMTMNERRVEFMSLQGGAPVRGSDLLKNEVVRCRLMAYLNQYGYEEMMRNTFLEICSKKGKKYWTQWVSRCFMLQKDLSDTPSETFLFPDKKYEKHIKIGHSSLNPSDYEFAEFHYKFLDFIDFLSKLNDIDLNVTQMFALFYYISHNTYNHKTLQSHMRNFSKEGQIYKGLWENSPETDMRRRYFNRCLEQLREMTEPAAPYDERPITKSLKKDVWKKCQNGFCEICRTTKIAKDSFECGHIQSRALGGQTELDNLIPICFDCNRSMGTRNAYEYRDDVYPLL